MIMFGLFATHEKTVFGFLLCCLVGSFVQVKPNHIYSKIAALGRRYSIAAGWLISACHVIHSVTLLDHGTETIRKSLACAVTAIMVGIYFSVFVFVHFQTVFGEQDKSYTAAK